MAKKKTTKTDASQIVHAIIENQPITETIEKNYMPYVMSVIVSRAIPEIDGFKPSHRKLLYTMYKMGLMTGARTKSTNVVGQTMKLNPHGDAAIYDTMVRLTKGHEALLHPFVDSKGTFGKHYSRTTVASAPRYTEVKLDPICTELFGGVDKNAVEVVPNYDNTMTEPLLLPTTFPNILVSPNMGIAVGMQSTICSFNLAEVCDGTIALLRHPKTDAEKLLEYIKAPDFSTGANLIFNREQLKSLYETGHGKVRLRARYNFDKSQNCIEVLQIPYSTNIEAIIDKITDLIKEGKLKEITDVRDEIGLDGFRLALDVKKGTDPDLLMAKLYKMTPLEDDFSCNFNVIIDGSPRQLGVVGILHEWIRFRMDCVRRELTYDLGKKKDKLHLLVGLGKILIDIDKAIRIVRETEKESDVVPRLMEGFSIDEVQAEYIADIKLRHLNREYIIERIKEIEELQREIAELESIISDDGKLKEVIVKQLTAIKKKYGKPRKTQLIDAEDIIEAPSAPAVENYPVYVVLTKEGYFKKITYRSLQGADEQRLKEGDEIANAEESENIHELIFFTDKAQAYKSKIADFETCKASALGDFLPAKLGFDDGESTVMMKALSEFREEHHFIFIFENGKGVRVPVSAYATKTNRRKLTGAFSDASPIVAVLYEAEPFDMVLVNSIGKGILINSALISEKTTRTAAGINLFTMKGNVKIASVITGEKVKDYSKLRKLKVPATGITINTVEDNQLTIG